MSASPSLADRLVAAGFRGRCRAEQPLGDLTTWRIGGPAELLAEPADREDLLLALRWAAEHGVAWRVLGNGSNLLVRDAGVRGMVLRIRRVLDDVRHSDERLISGGGATLPAVARFAASRGLAGLEFGAGVPGTIGGAVVMNAGWHEHEIGNAVESVEWVGPDAVVTEHPHHACRFGYRASRFRGERGVVLRTTLRLERGDPARISARLEQFARSRKENQPTELPSCGSVFLKPEGDFAGRLIDAAGLKGLRVGDVEVSPRHANFFVNLGSATACDVLALVEQVERRVLERCGVRLTREFEIW